MDKYDETVNAIPATAGTPTRSNVAEVGTGGDPAVIAAANVARRGLMVYNDSANNLFLALGAAASSTSYTCKVPGGAYYEMPYGYDGLVTGIWDGSTHTGAARVTELTA